MPSAVRKVKKLPHPMVVYINSPKEAEEIKKALIAAGLDNLETFTGNMSGYGPYQDSDGGWHLFRTATGWDLRNSIYYQDSKYGSLRIVASDTSIKKYSVVRCTLSNGTVINAIVLDRGDKNIGRGKKFEFDLAYKSATEALRNGVLKNVKFEILRDGR